jgi:hypothetical protein
MEAIVKLLRVFLKVHPTLSGERSQFLRSALESVFNPNSQLRFATPFDITVHRGYVKMTTAYGLD